MNIVSNINVHSLAPFTRDTFGIAVKATYCVVNGEMYEIFKNPKTDTGHFKKSQKGLCHVHYKDDGSIDYTDGFNEETIKYADTEYGSNLLETVFRDGKMTDIQSLSEIRNRLNGGNF